MPNQNFSLESAIDEITFLGCSLVTLPVCFDIALESLGSKRFKILKNIPVEGVPISLSGEDLLSYTIHEPHEAVQLQKHSLFFGVVGPKGKWIVFNHFREKYQIEESWFLNLVHPTSYIATSSRLAKGILLEPGVVISSQTRIGFGVSIKRGASIGHHNVIGEYVEINPGIISCGNVTIGRGCTLGAGCVIRDGTTIGENTLIGMGSVVTGDIPSNVIAYGNPCKVIRSNDAPKV